MPFKELFLYDEVVYNLKIMDYSRKIFSGEELQGENIMLTGMGEQIVSIIPLIQGLTEDNKVERLISIRSVDNIRAEIHRISIVKELAAILNERFGLNMIYQSKPIIVKAYQRS